MIEITYEVLENGDLQFACNDEYQAYLKECFDIWQNADRTLSSKFAYVRDQTTGILKQAPFTNVIEMERAVFANSEASGWPFEWIQPEDIGALTSAPILGTRDEAGELADIWWYPDYALRSPAEELCSTGKTVFTAAPREREDS